MQKTYHTSEFLSLELEINIINEEYISWLLDSNVRGTKIFWLLKNGDRCHILEKIIQKERENLVNSKSPPSPFMQTIKISKTDHYVYIDCKCSSKMIF